MKKFPEKEIVRDQDVSVISLLDLWREIAKQKKIVIFTTLAMVMLSLVYVVMANKVYESKSFVEPPSVDAIQNLLSWDVLLEREKSFDPLQLFTQFQQVVTSRSMLWKLFKENELYKYFGLEVGSNSEFFGEDIQVQEAFNRFYSGFSVKVSGRKDNRTYISLSLKLEASRAVVQQALSQHINNSIEAAKKIIVDSINDEKRIYINNVLEEILSKKTIANKKRYDRIVALDEAIAIAKSINLKSPPAIGIEAKFKGVNNQGMPLYYLGYKLLEAEKKILQERRDDAPFINGLRLLESRLEKLKGFSLSEGSFDIIFVDQEPNIGVKIKPNSLLIVSLALAFGLLLGSIFAVVRGS